MKLIQRCIRRKIRSKVFLSAMPLVLGTVLFFYCRQLGTVLSILSLLLVLTSIYLTRKTLKSNRLENHPLWELLLQRPLQIVWIHTVRTQLMPFGFYLWETGQMYFKLVDGKEISIVLPAKKLRMVSRFLNKMLPHATFGYSPENERLFQENPAQLFKDPSHM